MHIIKKQKNIQKNMLNRKINLIPSILRLEPLDLKEEEMKITDERKTFFHLLNAGYTEDEIKYIKKKCDKEGIKYTPLSFPMEELLESKKELREHLDKKKIKKMKKIIYEKFDIYSKNKFMY